MADVRIRLDVSSNGTIAAEAEQAKQLGDNLERARKAASVQNKLRGAEADATRGYRQFRGAAGTGAEARDFSKQAAGLGGLVHVYATFAANIFALTSAFTALSKAMDTTNMIAGLDQLGAASGKNLSGLTKQLMAAADGAISLKDALTATAQASAGGLTGEQLIRLTTVAKQASQALGRDMPDALSRLTRGITKIEPELLDELGILVKVEKANVDYARSLGKTASALTDLEKRQAFAVAAISQGEQKFKDIELAANPYQKILASTQNLTQSTLELVNVALVPVISLLAASPSGLALTIGGIAALLLKQAIPALGQWRAGLEQSAITARRASVEINDSFKQFQADNINRNSNAIAQRIQQQKTVLDSSVASLKEAATKGVKSVNGEISKIVSQPISDITDKQIAKIAATEKSFRTKAANLIATPVVGPPIDPKIAAEHNKQADALLRQADALKQLRQQIPLAQADSVAFTNAQKKAQEDLARSQGAFSEASQRQRIADRAERKAAQAEILSNVGRNTQIMGVRGAFAALRNDVRQGQVAIEQIGKVGEAGYVAAQAARKPLEGLAAAGTLVRGTFTIATSAVTTFLAAFGPWAAVIGIAVIAGSALINMLSSNTKQLNLFKNSVIETEGTVKLLANTLESINKKPVLQQISTESISARASAFGELASSVQKLADNLSKADKASSGFDKFIDQFKKLWGGDLRSQATKGLSAAIAGAVIAATDESKAILEESLGNILKTADLTSSGISKALDEIPLEDFVVRQGQISDAIAKANSGLQKQSDALVSVKSTLDEVSKTASTLIVNLTSQDSFGKFAVSVVNASNSIAKALETPNDALTVLITLAGDVGRLSSLSGDMAAELIGSTPELEKQVEAIKGAGKAVELYSVAISDAQTTINKSTKNSFYDLDTLAKAQENLKGLKLGKQEAIKIQQDLQVTVQPSTINLLKRVIEDSFKNGAELMQIAMKNAQEAASITVAKAAASGLSGPGTADVNFKLRSREISLQEQQLKAELGLLTAQNENKNALEKLTNVVALDTQIRVKQAAEVDLKAGTGNKEELTRIIKNSEESIKTTNKAIELGNAITRNLQSLKGLSPKEASSQLTSQIAGSTDIQGRAALQATQSQLLGAIQKQIANEAEREVAALTRSLEIIREKAAVSQKDKDAKLQSIELDLKGVEATQSVLGYYDKTLQDKKQALVIDKQTTQNLKDRLIYESTIAELTVRSTGGISTASQIQQVNAERSKQITASRIKDEQELSALTIDRLTREEKERQRLVELSNIDAQNQKSSLQAQLEYNELLLSTKITLGTVSETDAARQDAANARARLALETENTLREKAQEYETKMASLRIQSEAALANARQGKDTGQVSALFDQQNLVTAQYNAQIATINQINSLKATGISLSETTASTIAKENEQLEKQATLVKVIETTTVSLSAVFGKVGSAIGSIAKSLQKSAADQIAIEKKKSQEILKITKNGETDPKEKAKIEKKFALESASVQMGAAADVAGAVADSFDEQSSAAAAFHKIEKAFHIAKLAMDIAGLASTWAVVLGEEIAASQTALAWIPAVWARAFGEGGPYLGWALGAAAVAMIFSGGGGSKGSSAPTSKQKQEVQGTGQEYNEQGELVDTMFTGVLGDRTAKSESITNSLELIAQYTFEELEYSNKTLTALQNIANSLAGVSKGIVLTTGILSGTAFGTQEGAVKSFLGNVFGGNTSTNITGTGLNIKGSVSSLAQRAGTVQQYENVTQTKSGGLFGLFGGSSKDLTKTTALSGQIVESLGLVFDNIKKSLVEVGTTLGLGAEELANKINQIPVDISIELRGLKGKELEEAVSSVLSSTLDNITEQALSIVKPFQKLGEGLAETAIRVANDSRVVDLQLKSVGATFGTAGLQPVVTSITKTIEQIVGYEYDYMDDYFNNFRNRLVPITEMVTVTELVTTQKTAYEAKEALIELSGGLEEFVSKSDFFKDNFLSEAQKLAPVQKAVTDELARLGLSALDTRDEFSALILSLDLSVTKDQELYVSLMNLAQGFATVYEASESLSLTIKELTEAQYTQELKLLELLGDKGKALNLTREKELKGLDARLKPMQLWIYALEDEADARSALTDAYEAESSSRQASIDKLKASRDSLLEFSKSLALGQTSPLTPEQKYKEAKSNLKAVTDVLDNNAATAEDRSKALEKLPSAISSLLDTSKIFNASSQAFQQDYTLSQKLLKDNSDKLGQQISFEERSLKELTAQVEKLGIINTSIKDTNSLIVKLTEAITKSQAAASGVGTSANEAIVKSIYNTNPILSPNDTAGQNFWIDKLNTGTSIAQVQDAITKTTLVRSWYRNALGREAEQAGIDFWVDRLNKSNDIKKVKQEFAVGASVENKRPVMPIDSFENGGHMSGMAVVGEVGAEVVDFDNPGRVYSNNDSKGLMDGFGRAIADELGRLRNQVASLQKDANKNAALLADVIKTANSDAANKVAGSVEEAASTTSFQNRNVASIV